MGLCGKMPKTLVFQLLIAVFFNFILSVHTLEVDLTVDVKPGHEECFYEEIKKPTSLEVEYQVIDGGDLDINFMVTSPHGRIMVSELMKSDAVHKLDALDLGVYKVCFDNTFSHFARKLVFFEIITGDEDEDEDDDKKDWKAAQEELASIVDMTLEDFKKLLDNVNNNLDTARSDQQVLRNYEARDRNTQENNFQRVNFLSGVQVFIMLSVALTQVLLIRSLFDDRKKEVVRPQSQPWGRRRGARSMVPIFRWLGGIVPYEIPQGDFDEHSRALIKVAMRRWERQTCIRFVPLSEHAQSESYIKFYKSKTCFSDLGRNTKQTPQLLGLAPNCMGIPTIIHELGHALGMIHPMSREDRDQFITLRMKNIKPDSDQNFRSITDRGYMYFTYGVPYDYKSIMHYNAVMWSANGNETMVTAQPEYQSIIGKADDVSFRDNMYINRAYLCSWRCSGMRCENGGIAAGVPCRCVCPDGYHGNYCEKRLSGVNRIVDWRCGDGWFFRTGMCFKFLSHATIPWKTAQQLCQQNGGTLPIIRDQEMLRITGELVEEDKTLSSTSTFWLGLRRDDTTSEYIWEDGSAFRHHEWVSNIHNTSSSRPCAVFNGTFITTTDCGLQPDNGVLCMTPFDPACGGVFHLLDRSVHVTSPNYPDLYPPDSLCQYVFKISGNNKVKLSFDDFIFEYSKECTSDFLEVQLHSDVSIPGKRYCGSELRNTTLVSDGNFAVLTMKTNGRNPGAGFRVIASPVRNGARGISNPLLNLWRRFFQTNPGRFG
ncbi:protein SpAN-like [Crassostrea virginica]